MYTNKEQNFNEAIHCFATLVYVLIASWAGKEMFEFQCSFNVTHFEY